MDFDAQWLLIGLPVAFVLGWLASRLDQRQWRRDRRDAPRAYFEGLNLLLNEQQDKAIDAFIEAVQLDPDTTELHFALGNLFRRRGEFERAVRVHQHLLSRADLKARRTRPRPACAGPGLRQGRPLRPCRGRLAGPAGHALRGRGAAGAAVAVRALARLDPGRGHGRRTRAARRRLLCHPHRTLPLRAGTGGRRRRPARGRRAGTGRGRRVAPQAPRPLLLAGQRAWQAGDATAALAAWDALRVHDAALFALVAEDHARAAAAVEASATRPAAPCSTPMQPSRGWKPCARWTAWTRSPFGGSGLGADLRGIGRRLTHLERQPSLGAAAEVLAIDSGRWRPDTRQRLQAAVQRAAAPLQRYRCAACGFEAHHYFWQCPGCQGWDTYPPRPLEQQ
jgi:lipopolysaccharide biosynthesis regulator YciM